MEREIKFRAWDKSDMIYNVAVKNSLAYSHNEHLTVENGEPSYKIMQFTGILDKNGNEIYEGDILHLVYRKGDEQEDYINPADVIFNDVRWQIRCLKEMDHGLPLNWGGYESIEVIGNIHQNPELCQTQP